MKEPLHDSERLLCQVLCTMAGTIVVGVAGKRILTEEKVKQILCGKGKESSQEASKVLRQKLMNVLASLVR